MDTLGSPTTYEAVIKKSRFVVRAERVDTPEEAINYISCVREPDATHNCWAYKVGSQYRFSDDGEPGGTAGRPILAAIEGQHLDHVIVVVTRYFGGIKLGAGGLVRAYGGSAAECLRLAKRVPLKARSLLRLHVPFDFLGSIYPLIERFDACKAGETYGDQGVVLLLELDEDRKDELIHAVRDATRGKGSIAAVE